MRCTSFDQATVTNASLELLRVFPVNWTTFPNAPVHLEAYLSKMRGRQLELLQFQPLIKQTFGCIQNALQFTCSFSYCISSPKGYIKNGNMPASQLTDLVSVCLESPKAVNLWLSGCCCLQHMYLRVHQGLHLTRRKSIITSSCVPFGGYRTQEICFKNSQQLHMHQVCAIGLLFNLAKL